jgi:hypothetical protein
VTTNVTWDTLDWTSLHRLRETFLAGAGGNRDYWRNERDLAGYDLTFGQRIGWKWQHVLRELSRLGWMPASGPVWDWGCGTGVAARAWLRHWTPGQAGNVSVSDRSELAARFARDRIAAEFPGVTVLRASEPAGPVATMLLSHVITELSEDQLTGLLARCASATTVVWLEPGTKVAADRLVQARERLTGKFHPVAPCAHAGACGMMSDANARHWCHHFAVSPPEVFTCRNWARFAQLSGVDLRVLPLSYLVLDKREPNALPAGATRVIGAPRLYKGYARLLCCDADGVRDRRLTQRVLPDRFREAKKGHLAGVYVVTRDGDEICRMEPLDAGRRNPCQGGDDRL